MRNAFPRISPLAYRLFACIWLQDVEAAAIPRKPPCAGQGPFSPRIDPDLSREDLVVEPAELPLLKERRSLTVEEVSRADRGVCWNWPTVSMRCVGYSPPPCARADFKAHCETPVRDAPIVDISGDCMCVQSACLGFARRLLLSPASLGITLDVRPRLLTYVICGKPYRSGCLS
jgi:hypothetical protein